MDPLRVALVTKDAPTRLAAARAFDRAPLSWSLELCVTPPPSADVVLWGPDLAGDGQARFDPSDPDRFLSDIEAAARSPASKVVVVTSASGGAGTTTIALHLAAAWRAGTAWFLEWGPGVGGAATRLGLEEGDTKTWADVDGSHESLALASLPVQGGFRALFAPAEGDRPADLIPRARTTADVVIVDAGASSDSAAALEVATCGVLVVPPTHGGAARARALLAQHPATDWAIVVNRTGGGGDLTAVALANTLGRRITLELPHTPRLRYREDEGELLALGWSRWGSRMLRLARALENA